MTKFYLIRLVLLFPTYLTILSNAESPLLQTNIGEFEGKLLEFEEEQQKVDAFYGLPFANKPKRFEVSFFCG
jgi:hypothetical protein